MGARRTLNQCSPPGEQGCPTQGPYWCKTPGHSPYGWVKPHVEHSISVALQGNRSVQLEVLTDHYTHSPWVRQTTSRALYIISLQCIPPEQQGYPTRGPKSPWPLTLWVHQTKHRTLCQYSPPEEQECPIWGPDWCSVVSDRLSTTKR